jgi:hypothetical protein
MKSPTKRTVVSVMLALAVAAGGVFTAAARHSGRHSDGESGTHAPRHNKHRQAATPPAHTYVFEVQESGGTTGAITADPSFVPSPAPDQSPTVQPSSVSSSASISPARTEAGPVVAWPVAAGGNGHTYQAVAAPDGINWADAQAWAVAHGGYLATITSAAENNFVFNLIDDPKFWWNNDGNSSGPWLGGFQPPGSPEADGGWQWLNGEGAFAYTNWAVNEPDDAGPGQNSLNFYAWGMDHREPTLDDERGTLALRGFVVEYSGEVVRTDASPGGSSSAKARSTSAGAMGASLPTTAAPGAAAASGASVASAVPVPVTVTSELKIISAIFSGRTGEADVTAVVAEKVRPGAEVFFASPKWLGVDPAVGWKKTLVITYEFRGQAATYSAREGVVVSYDALEANGGGTPAAVASPAGVEPRIIAAYFGTGSKFADVTARVAELIGASHAEFRTTEATLQTDPTPGLRKEFMVIYEIGGQRRTFTTYDGGACSRELLVANSVGSTKSE